jgi:hypothetical protein
VRTYFAVCSEILRSPRLRSAEMVFQHRLERVDERLAERHALKLNVGHRD